MLQNRSRFTGDFWLGYRAAEKEDWKKGRKLEKSERSGENCKEGEREQKCRRKRIALKQKDRGKQRKKK